MSVPVSPTVRRLRLASELRQIRERKGRSGENVAAALGWSSSKVSRYERALTSLPPRDVERLLDYYQVTGPQRASLLALADQAARKGWWQGPGDEVPGEYQQFIGLEAEAASIDIWQAAVIPGLLQTAAYARHIITSYSRIAPVPPGQAERLVRLRMRRQQVLDREDLQLTAVLDESVLHRQAGEAPVMHQQLEHLAEIAGRPNVTVRILPLASPHRVYAESFVIFGYGTSVGAMPPDLVAVEQLLNGGVLDGERETHLHRLAFQALADVALPPSQSAALILEAARSHQAKAASQEGD